MIKKKEKNKKKQKKRERKKDVINLTRKNKRKKSWGQTPREVGDVAQDIGQDSEGRYISCVIVNGEWIPHHVLVVGQHNEVCSPVCCCPPHVFVHVSEPADGRHCLHLHLAKVRVSLEGHRHLVASLRLRLLAPKRFAVATHTGDLGESKRSGKGIAFGFTGFF